MNVAKLIEILLTPKLKVIQNNRKCYSGFVQQNYKRKIQKRLERKL